MVRTIKQCGCCGPSDSNLRCRICDGDTPNTFTFTVRYTATHIAGPTSSSSTCPGIHYEGHWMTDDIGWDEPERTSLCDTLSGTYMLTRVPGIWTCYSQGVFGSLEYKDSIFWRGGIVTIEYPEDQRVEDIRSCGGDGQEHPGNRPTEFEWILKVYDPVVDPPRCSYILALVPKYITEHVFTTRPAGLTIPTPLCQMYWFDNRVACFGYGDGIDPWHTCIAGIGMNRHTYGGSSTNFGRLNSCKNIYLDHAGTPGGQHRRGPVCFADIIGTSPIGIDYRIKLIGN